MGEDDPIPSWLAGVLMMDGEMSQIKALVEMGEQDNWDSFKIALAKLPASCSGMLQPCDLAECFRYLKQLLKLHETKAATEQGALAAVAKITAEFGAKDAAAAVAAAAGGAAPELVLVGAPPPMAILAEGSPHHPVTRSLSDGLKNAPEGGVTLSKLKLISLGLERLSRLAPTACSPHYGRGGHERGGLRVKRTASSTSTRAL